MNLGEKRAPEILVIIPNTKHQEIFTEYPTLHGNKIKHTFSNTGPDKVFYVLSTTQKEHHYWHNTQQKNIQFLTRCWQPFHW